MATHLTGTGLARILRLADRHEQIAAACRTVLAELGLDARAKKQPRHSSVIAAALDIDRGRRATNGHGHGTPANKKTAQRRRTAKLLRRIEQARTPVTGLGLKAPVLVRHGFIKKQGDGYVRTDKEFIP